MLNPYWPVHGKWARPYYWKTYPLKNHEYYFISLVVDVNRSRHEIGSIINLYKENNLLQRFISNNHFWNTWIFLLFLDELKAYLIQCRIHFEQIFQFFFVNCNFDYLKSLWIRASLRNQSHGVFLIGFDSLFVSLV